MQNRLYKTYFLIHMMPTIWITYIHNYTCLHIPPLVAFINSTANIWLNCVFPTTYVLILVIHIILVYTYSSLCQPWCYKLSVLCVRADQQLRELMKTWLWPIVAPNNLFGLIAHGSSSPVTSYILLNGVWQQLYYVEAFNWNCQLHCAGSIFSIDWRYALRPNEAKLAVRRVIERSPKNTPTHEIAPRLINL